MAAKSAEKAGALALHGQALILLHAAGPGPLGWRQARPDPAISRKAENAGEPCSPGFPKGSAGAGQPVPPRQDLGGERLPVADAHPLDPFAVGLLRLVQAYRFSNLMTFQLAGARRDCNMPSTSWSRPVTDTGRTASFSAVFTAPMSGFSNTMCSTNW